MMRAAVVTFPGSNCDRDLSVALGDGRGRPAPMVWHKETSLPPGIDLIAIPGGFSFGDYLRCGAIAAQSPVMAAVRAFAERGGYVLGICNGFQVLIETRLLPGALLRNAGLDFVCRPVRLRVATANSAFTAAWQAGAEIRVPVAHHDGNYFAPPETIRRLHGEDRVAFTYAEEVNGSMAAIAGVLSENRRILGMMPHPERAADPALGLTDGAAMFRALAA
jgi:phosphoribosylformylglycinamidine synthase